MHQVIILIVGSNYNHTVRALSEQLNTFHYDCSIGRLFTLQQVRLAPAGDIQEGALPDGPTDSSLASRCSGYKTLDFQFVVPRLPKHISSAFPARYRPTSSRPFGFDPVVVKHAPTPYKLRKHRMQLDIRQATKAASDTSGPKP